MAVPASQPVVPPSNPPRMAPATALICTVLTLGSVIAMERLRIAQVLPPTVIAVGYARRRRTTNAV